MSARVAVLGLGAMGLPMATALARTFDVVAYDIADERVGLAVEAGATGAASVAEACTGTDVVVVGVRDGAQLDALVLGDGGVAASLPAGAVVVVTSTVGEDAVRSTAAALAARGILTVDAPVSGGPVRAGTGDLLVMVGADDDALAAARPVLDALSSSLTVVGGIGAGQQLKTVNQLLCGIHTAAASEALALAHRLGLDLDACIEVLGQGAAASFMLADRGPRIAQQLRGETPPLRSRLDVIGKDMGIVGDLTRRLKVATPVAAAAEQLYRQVSAAGLDAADDSVVATRLLREETW
ncbi:6-phosphogluconate dehydrogenase NAD-binding protein [Cellulomonas flavigena DSM 20109]|uniref:6-phosphogluconate dehydrogenase NAD-binding protein n=1 Tax=Cellulomonas flavigena (strain ATCC 482 / DSM 20109 / BCRC 11376 / JCM 18109 / NBRC 3775 / NCIMB 8073 / NRS 134) TaxID=446466 RepID=D5UGB9_CELFN|nr:NAD(P)-dependent oxidoreductase [Cellulomonas flavigena]ADG73102.1 6-phosphogluconate dehydrogenase NAD-binding protein [Cellulomonas flavigena DSM 20109]